VPDKMPSDKVVINAEMVKQKLDSIVKNRDLSKFIL
jgi:ATP-dependent protease HslVU (ClpYQ) ATPase subunit